MPCGAASRRVLVAAILVAAGLWALSGPSAASQPKDWRVLFLDNFEDESSERWDIHRAANSEGTWKVETEQGNHVLAGTGPSSVTLGTRQYWSDFRFKARILVLRGSILLNYRAANASTYFLGFQPAYLRLGRSEADRDFDLVMHPDQHTLGRWYDVEIVGVGANLKVYVDGVLKIDCTDPLPLSFGTVGFEAPADSLVRVDDVEVSAPPSLEGVAWVRTGGPIGGIGYDVRMRPDNPDVMFVTDTFSGVHKSVDGGSTWFSANQGILAREGASGDAIPVFCLTIDPVRPDTVWAGTQSIRGIYRSDDAGMNWTAKVQGIVERNGIAFRGLTVDPRNPNIVYAAAEISSVVWAGQQLTGREFDLTRGVVYRSLDAGANWSPIWRGDNLARYVWIDPRDSNLLYVSTGIFDREAANSDMLHGVPGGVGILKSTDGGATWRALNEANGLANLYVGSLFMHPLDPDILLAGAGFNGGPQETAGIYLSTDGGEHWQRGIDLSTGKPVTGLITSVEFALSDPRIAYAASDTVFFRSADGGRGWQLMAGGPPLRSYGPPGVRTGYPIDLQVDPRNPDRVFINNYGGGNFLSEDGGRTWTCVSRGYTGSQQRQVAVDRGDPRLVWSIGKGGIFRSLDGGGDWEGLNYMPGAYEWYAVAPDPGNPEHILISDQGEGVIFRSSSGGLDWSVVFRHPEVDADDFRKRHGFKALAFSPSNLGVVYGGMCRVSRNIDAGLADPSFGVYKSVDGGETWLEANDPVTTGQNINVLAVDYRSDSIVYAGTVKSGIARTTDGGRTWTALNDGLRVLDVRALAIDPQDWTVLYAGTEGGGVYKSVNAGGNWQAAGYGMDPQAAVRAIAIDPRNSQVIYAADQRTGVYRSVDAGKHWTQLSDGLRTRAVNTLAISADGGTLYAGTDGEGVFRLDVKPLGR